MIVEPGLPDDPKYLRLKKALRAMDGQAIALEMLVRLWGHCQLNQRGEFWPGADADYVEAVCRWDGEAGKLFALLVDKGWVEVETGDQSGARIHDWGEANAGILARWENGKKGGRKKGRKTKPNSPDHPIGNLPVTDRLPIGEPMKGKREGKSEGLSAPPDEFPEVSWPSEEEVRRECDMRGIAPALGTKFWRHYEGLIPKWTSNGSNFDWRMKLWDWHVTDSGKNGPSKKAPGPGGISLEDIKAELQWQKDPARIEFLKKTRDQQSGGVQTSGGRS